jgi:hypothetical protein
MTSQENQTSVQTPVTANASPLFYQRVVALDGNLHSKLKLSAQPDLKFSARSPVVPLLCVEFTEAAREYPIAFLRGANNAWVPVALTGAPDGDNVYMDAHGRWNARYVPAYVRRYPFVVAQLAPEQLTVCIDEAYAGFNESEGTALFEEGGGASSTLRQIVANLAEYQRQAQLTESFMQRLDAAGLLMEANAQAKLSDGRGLMLKGFWIVDEARFRALPEATLKQWFASGELGLVYAHLSSLGNLLELLRRQPAAQTNAGDAASAGDPSSVGDAPSVGAAANTMSSSKRRRGGRNAA